MEAAIICHFLIFLIKAKKKCIELTVFDFRQRERGSGKRAKRVHGTTSHPTCFAHFPNGDTKFTMLISFNIYFVSDGVSVVCGVSLRQK